MKFWQWAAPDGHADPDDFTMQPAGAAGGRVSCGVIEGKGSDDLAP